MPTLKRHDELRNAVKVKADPAVCYGCTPFVDEFANPMCPEEQQLLGTRSLYARFEGKRDGRGNDVGWTLALLEMLTDPMLLQWVPEWVVEQYERANPFFRETLKAVIEEGVQTNGVSK